MVSHRLKALTVKGDLVERLFFGPFFILLGAVALIALLVFSFFISPSDDGWLMFIGRIIAIEMYNVAAMLSIYLGIHYVAPTSERAERSTASALRQLAVLAGISILITLLCVLFIQYVP